MTHDLLIRIVVGAAVYALYMTAAWYFIQWGVRAQFRARPRDPWPDDGRTQEQREAELRKREEEQ